MSPSPPKTGGPTFTVIFTLEALSQLRALPSEVRDRVQSRADFLAWSARGTRASPSCSSMRWSSVEGAQFFYEVCPAEGTLRVIRVLALPGEPALDPNDQQAG